MVGDCVRDMKILKHVKEMGVLQIGLEFGLYLENDLRTDLVGKINNSCDLMEACFYLGKTDLKVITEKRKNAAQSYFARSSFGCQLPDG